MSILRTPKTRWSASLAHLALSVLVIGSIAAFAFAHWFPAGLHHAAKLDKLLGIMLGVDIVVGPLLTLILYRAGKRGLKLDLATIVVLQLAFLSYGLSTLWRSRPLFLVGSQQAFALIFANELDEAEVARAKKNRWPRFNGSGPWLVGVDLSSDIAREEFLFAYLGGDAGPLRDPDLFVPYAQVSGQVARRARELTPDVPTQGLERDRIKSVALLSARSREGILLLDSTNGLPLRVVSAGSAR